MKKMRYDMIHGITELYRVDEVASTLPDELNRVIRYYKQGYQWYTRNIGPMDKDEYQEGIDLLESLRAVSNEMCVIPESCLVVQDATLQVNATAFADWMDSREVQDILYKLRTIKARMVHFLHEGDLLEYREVHEIVERIELFFVSNYFRPIAL